MNTIPLSTHLMQDTLLTNHVMIRIMQDQINDEAHDMFLLQTYFGIELPRMSFIRRIMFRSRLKEIFILHGNFDPRTKENALDVIASMQENIKRSIADINTYQSEMDAIIAHNNQTNNN